MRDSDLWGVERGDKKAIIQELLDKGAQRLVRGRGVDPDVDRGVDRLWTPLALAAYHSLGEDVVALLMPTVEDRTNMSDEDRKDWESRGNVRGVLRSGGFCDHCFLVRIFLVCECSQVN